VLVSLVLHVLLAAEEGRSRTAEPALTFLSRW
jgi:hypothetical protein